MSTHTLRKGVAATLPEQARDALEAIAGVMSAEGAAGRVVHQAVFLADGGSADYAQPGPWGRRPALDVAWALLNSAEFLCRH
jgi:hypothetical protein